MLLEQACNLFIPPPMALEEQRGASNASQRSTTPRQVSSTSMDVTSGCFTHCKR
jgi:hypothetical protein